MRGKLEATTESRLIATAKTRFNLAILHLRSAATFAKRATDLEKQQHGNDLGTAWEGILAQTSACVMLCCASLEAYANELFANRETVFAVPQREEIERNWKYWERETPIEKLEIAIALLRGTPFDRGGAKYESVSTLLQLRNAIVHFKPDVHGKLARSLPKRIRSPWFPEPEPLFPRAWASAECSRWALESTKALIIDFELRKNPNGSRLESKK